MTIKTIIEKIVVAGAFLAFSQTAFADANVLKIGGGFSVGTRVTTNDSDIDTLKRQFIQIQHGASLVPNYRFTNYSSESEIKGRSDTVKLKLTSHELFYTLGFSAVEMQLGASSDNFKVADTKYKSTGLVANFIFDIPLLPLTPSLNTIIGSGDEKVDSVGINFAWGIAPNFYLDFGGRNYTYKVKSNNNKFTIKNETAYLGLSFNFGF